MKGFTKKLLALRDQSDPNKALIDEIGMFQRRHDALERLYNRVRRKARGIKFVFYYRALCNVLKRQEQNWRDEDYLWDEYWGKNGSESIRIMRLLSRMVR